MGSYVSLWRIQQWLPEESFLELCDTLGQSTPLCHSGVSSIGTCRYGLGITGCEPPPTYVYHEPEYSFHVNKEKAMLEPIYRANEDGARDAVGPAKHGLLRYMQHSV